MSKQNRALLLVLCGLSGCARSAQAGADAHAPPGPVTISVVGTNDLHGQVDRLAVFAGYLANLRQTYAKRRGGVVLVDAGDLFQGTLESNLGEGDVIVDAYNSLGYTAATIGNHEFDFGPVGPRATPRDSQEDALGALRARIQQARFPFVSANLVDTRTGAPVLGVPPSVLVGVAGVRVGIIGATTEATLHTTIAANVRDLAVTDLAEAIQREAVALRKKGAVLVVALVHAGGRCEKFGKPTDTSSCDASQEVMALAKRLSSGSVDVIVAGHTHAGMAHEVNGIAVIESYASGRAFGRVDFEVAGGKVVGRTIFAPRDVCGYKGGDAPACPAGEYEGAQVVARPSLEDLVAPARARAAALKAESLGVTLTSEIPRAYDRESALGNLFADLMRKTDPSADVAITNGGGLRADLPAGELTYGRLYESFPFDNQLTRVTTTGRALYEMLEKNLRGRGGALSLSGVWVSAACTPAGLRVEARRANGVRIGQNERLTLVTTDFLATGGDNALGLAPEHATVTVLEGRLVRDEMANVLRARGGTRRQIDASEFFDAKKPRWTLPGPRPLTCR